MNGDSQVNVNPYFSSYWMYSSLAFNAAFERELPLWLRHGLAGVLANSIVRDNEIKIGHSVPWFHSSIVQEGRLRSTQLLTTDWSSLDFTSRATRDRFDAQSWGVVHYMLFGEAEDKVDRLNAVTDAVAQRHVLRGRGHQGLRKH